MMLLIGAWARKGFHARRAKGQSTQRCSQDRAETQIVMMAMIGSDVRAGRQKKILTHHHNHDQS
jgi:hypothetical protein